MRSSSYVIMWLTMFLVLILAIVLALVLLLLAELYRSPLTRRNRHHQLTPPTAATTIINNSPTHSHSTHANPLNDIEKQPPQPSPENKETREINSCLKDSVSGCSLVYISNPIYYGEGNGTPFETPESSPSRLEMEYDDEREEVSSKVVIKKLPVCVKDVGLLGTSGSDYTNGVSSSCSLTPCTSPSL